MYKKSCNVKRLANARTVQNERLKAQTCEE